MRKAITGIMLTSLFFIFMLTLGFNIQTVEAEPTTIIVPDDYPTIQGAVNAANSGDTVYVRAGTYYEHVTIDKSISLIGEDKYNTIIDGNYDGIVVTVTAHNVKITGFTAQNSGSYSGIYVGSSGNNISCNIITNNRDGIYLDSSFNNTISGNNIVANFDNGIRFYISSNNSIYHNNFVDNSEQVRSDSSTNIWDNSYPSGGNYWSDYTDVDLFSGPSQNESGSDGIWDYPYIINVDNEDRYPLVEPNGVLHDIAVTGIGFHHSTLYGNITVTTTYNGENVNFIYIDAWISNNGEAPETVETTFTYTIADVPTTIGVVFVDVAAGSTATASVGLDTGGFPVGYLPITVEATEVYNEGNTLNNNMTTTLWIKHVGDVQGDPFDPYPIRADGDVDRYDSGAVAMAYGYVYPHPRYNVEADFDRDGDVDRYDSGNLAQNYGIIFPPYEPL